MKQHSEPAFPVEIDGEGEGKQTGPSSAMATGMTLRDYMAAKAMQSLMLDRWYQSDDFEGRTAQEIGPHLASDAYAYADAMLAQREN